jgi:hypothetical protein
MFVVPRRLLVFFQQRYRSGEALGAKLRKILVSRIAAPHDQRIMDPPHERSHDPYRAVSPISTV